MPQASVRFSCPVPPQAEQYFQRLLSDRGAAWLKTARAGGKKVVGYFCTVLPQELFLAAGAVPFRLCAGAWGESAPGAPLARDSCPVVAAAWDTLRAGLAAELEAIVVCTTCDWKTKLADLLRAQGNVFLIDLSPGRPAEEVVAEWEGLCAWLADITDVPVTRARLEQAIDLVAQAHQALRALFALRRRKPPAISGSEAMLVADALYYGDVAGWTAACRRLADALARAPRESRPARPRVLLTGAPIIWPNDKLPRLIEQAGADIVCEEFCSRLNVLYENGAPRGRLREMLLWLARRAVERCACTFSLPVGRRVALVRRALSDFEVSGVVYHILRGCAPAAVQAAPLARALREAGVPVLELETDYSAEDVEPLRTRIESFVGMLQAPGAEQPTAQGV